MAARFCKNFN